jgi:hypothetical protein
VLGAAARDEEEGGDPNVLLPQLCPLQARDPMQLWQVNNRDQLVNRAGYVLEVSSVNVGGVRMRLLSTDTTPTDRQKWMFDSNRLINFARRGGGAVKLAVTGETGVQLVPIDMPAPLFTQHSIPPGCGQLSVRVTADGPTRILHGARFSTGIHTRGCHWCTRRCSAGSEQACDQWHSSRASTFLTSARFTLRPNTEG